MGQYYHPVSLEKKSYVSSHDFDNGLKLMEHSYIGNKFVNAVEQLIAKGGNWFGDRIVWAGDYADPELNDDGSISEKNLVDLCEDRIKPQIDKIKYFRFLVNRTKKEFVDLSKVPVCDTYHWKDDNGKIHTTFYKIHPLPLLTCEGNGRGGGDYHGKSNLIGSWARDVIQPQTKKPKGEFKEIIFTLV